MEHKLEKFWKDYELGLAQVPEIMEGLVNYLYEIRVDCDAVDEVFMAIFRQDQLASFSAVLKNHPTRLFPEVDPTPTKGKWLVPSDELQVFKTKLVTRRVAHLIEKSLAIVSHEELPQFVQVVEEQVVEAHADLDAHKFNVSDIEKILDQKKKKQKDKILSCLQMAVPLFARGAPSSKLIDYVNKIISLPDFHELSEQRKFDFLGALAEISSHTTPQVARQMLPSVVELLKKFIPTDIEESKSYAYVECCECLLYVLLHFSLKAPDVATKLCNEEFMSSFTSLRSRTRERMKILAKTLLKDDERFLLAEKSSGVDRTTVEIKFKAETIRQGTKTELRSCSNILAITKFWKDKKSLVVKLSWKEAKKALLTSERYRGETYSEAPKRSAVLESLSKDCYNSGVCNPSDREVVAIVGNSKFQQYSRKRDGLWYLNDTGGVAMLSWKMKKRALRLKASKEGSELKTSGKTGRSGQVRNQMYHLTCAMYTASDLVSSERKLRGWEKEYFPLCTWYLCAFCEPSQLGKDKRSQKRDDRSRLHHCFGTDIENVLCHISANGVPRETVSDFLCTDYQPPSADEPSMERRKIPKPRRINTLLEVMEVLRYHTVGADLIQFSQLYKGGDVVYEGPMTRSSVFIAYHAVIIESIKETNDDWIATCKMSNGTMAGDNGYCNVSLTTQYIPVGVSDTMSDCIRGSNEPMHLLTNFVIVEMKNAEKDEKKNWESDGKENDENPSKEKQKGNPSKEKRKGPEEKQKEPEGKKKKFEEKKYTHGRKRLHSASGYIFNTPSDLLVNSVGMLSIEDPKTQVTESDAVDVTVDAIYRHNSNSSTELTALVALQKCFPSMSERVKDIVVKQKGSLHLEMQQRAIEYNSIVEMHKTIRCSLVERMPVLDKASLYVRSAGSFPAFVSAVAKPSVNLPNGVEKPAVAPIVELLALASADILAAPGADFLKDLLGVDLGSLSSQSGANQAPKDGSELLLDMLLIRTPPAQNSIPSIDLSSTHSEQETLELVVVWYIGEYDDLLVNNVGMLGIEDPITVMESGAVDVIEDDITCHNSDSTTKAMALVTLLKLSSRFPSISERIKDIIVKQKGSILLEMQQRAIEYNSIAVKHKNIRFLKFNGMRIKDIIVKQKGSLYLEIQQRAIDRHQKVRSSLVERMSELDEATFNVRRGGSLPASVSTTSKPSVSIPSGIAAAPLVDVGSYDILAALSSFGTDFLQDLLGVDLGSSSAESEETGLQRVISF